MATETPNPKSQEQLIGEMLADYISRTGVNDVNVGSLVTQLFETVGLVTARASGDNFQVLRDRSVDRATGEALRRIARDEGLQELPARVATGTVTITDTNFSKISTKVYAGSKAPNIGTITLNLSDASQFPLTGSVYIGRGTPNIEGPLPYSNPTPVGGFWQITLTSPTTKFHNINESVVVAQGGNRTISSGITVRAPSTGATADINSTVTQPATILDGEVSVSDVQISAQEPGVNGNVPIGAIKEFSSAPFSGASVTNLLPLKTGRDVETDESLRIRVKRARLSKGLGTSLAVKNSVIGASPSDENSIITSSEIQTSAGETVLYVDDQTGYEQKTRGVGVEFLVDSALGGERNFQLETGGRQTSVAKAFLISNLSAPFDIIEGDRIAISVGGVVTEYTFSNDDFISPGGVTAYEIVAAINSNSDLLFEAATSAGGTKVVIQARANDNEDVQVADVTLGRNASVQMGFPTNKVETLKLFKNKNPLSKDGSTATIKSERQANWSNTIANGDTLDVSVDGTSSISYAFLNADFVSEGSHNTVSSSNSLESWVNVINAKVTGITATIVGEQIYLTSNLGTSARAKVEILNSSTLVSKNMFSVDMGLVATGKSSDFEFSRNTAQIKLNTPLTSGDELTVGSRETEARVQSSRILGGTVTLSSNANLWALFDDPEASIVNTGVQAQTILDVSSLGGDIVRYTSNILTAFSSVLPGDYVIVWSTELSSANRLEGRVNAVTGSTLDIKITSAESAAIVPEAGVIYQEGFVVIRTDKVPQRLEAVSGVRFLGDIADEFNTQLKAGQFLTLDDEILAVRTNTKTEDGSVLIVTFDDSAKLLGFTSGASDTSKDSLLAFYESGYKEGSFPKFFHSFFSGEASANPPSTFISSILSDLDPEALGLDPSGIAGYLHPYGTVLDALSTSESTEISDIASALITIRQDRLVKRLRSLDRYYLANGIDFGQEDEISIVLDSDAPNKTFSIPFFRRVLTNSSNPNNPNTFNAYDFDGGPTASFLQFFPGFDFSDFKVLMQAKRVIDGPATEDAILIRSVRWGRSGERINFAYTYPTVANSDIMSTITVDQDIPIRLSLKSGAPVATNIDGTTEWDITITPNTPVAGVDQVSYTWTGIGSSPGLGGLAGGEYVNITSGSELSSKNTGVFRVSDEVGFAPTANSFTVVRKNGEAESQLNVATLVAGIFSFYQADPTTVQEVNDYINANLSAIITSTVVDDGGTTGAGVIELSTLEQSNFTTSSFYLLDGINWLLVSDTANSPQFTFKRPLDYPSDTGYAFNLGENLRFVPVSADQVVRFANVLAVTGFTTLGSSTLVSREGRIELATKLLGGDGSVQIVGGLANSSETPVIGNSSVVNNSRTLTSIGRSGLSGLHSDHWVKLEAQFKQSKTTSFRETANIRIQSDFPAIGKSTVSFFNRTLTDRHFGRPRLHTRTNGRTFKVEKQGDFTCISWDLNGLSPNFEQTLNLNDSTPGDYNIEKIDGSSEARVTVLNGLINFTPISIGDNITISNTLNPANSGTFLVTGVSEDGKTIQYLNPSSVDEFSTGSFTILDNLNVSGDEFTVGITTLTAGVDFLVGVDENETATNLAAAISAIPGFLSISNMAVVNISATSAGSTAPISYNDAGGGGGASVSGTNLVGTAYAPGDFSCVSSLKEGDTVSISAPFSPVNRGQFRIVRRFNDSFYIENENSIEETVTLPNNPVSLGYDGTTEILLQSVFNRARLTWTGTGTEPFFGVAKPGDELTFGADFSIDNQGVYTVLSSSPKKAQTTLATLIPGSAIPTGSYWLINSAEDVTLYYVWYDVDGGGGDPGLIGLTGIQVSITSSDSAIQVATATSNAIDLLSDFSATSVGNQVTVLTSDFGETANSANGNMPAPFTVQTLQQGTKTFIDVLNTNPTLENVLITDVLELHSPQIKFYEYEATVSGDAFVVTSDFLGEANRGSWVVEEVISPDSIVVTGTMLETDETSIFDNQETLMIEEALPYSGYKQVLHVVADPNSTARGIVVFTTKEQANKINDTGAVQISTASKLNFNTTLRKGLDSYRYHTGLIGEANRIVYGDPRDNTTYPGVAAAGAEIFIREPLFRRVSLGIDVRIETGIPFAQIVEQVRTNVSSLIESNDIGQSIAISDIVEIVNIIPGVRAVAISSPLYNSSNETIRISPSEKARIIDPTTDISVRQITT